MEGSWSLEPAWRGGLVAAAQGHSLLLTCKRHWLHPLSFHLCCCWGDPHQQPWAIKPKTPTTAKAAPQRDTSEGTWEQLDEV